MLELHPNAVENLDRKAQEILGLIQPITPQQMQSDSFQPEYDTHTIDNSKIVEVWVRDTSYFGHPKGMRFRHDNVWYGIVGEPYGQVRDLLKSITKVVSISSIASSKTILRIIENWIEEKFTNVAEGDQFSAYLLSSLKSGIADRQILVPIAGLSIEVPFTIGKVDLIPLTRDFMAAWRRSLLQDRNDPEMEQWFERDFRQFQGFTAARTFITAEPEKSREVVFERIREALGVLRVFTPHASRSLDYSPIAMWGAEDASTWWCHTFVNGVPTLTSHHRIGFVTKSLVIDTKLLQTMFDVGLREMSVVLQSGIATKYYEKLLSSILLFSEASTKRNVPDKLVYTTVALESFLSTNPTEPIQWNLADRIAYLMEELPEKRMEVVKLVKDGYAARSAYVHHGKHPENDIVVRDFIHLVWMLFMKLSMNSAGFQTVEEMLNWIDKRKYS